MSTLVFCLGPTGSGKSSLVELAVTKEGFAAVMVGKELRKRYSPEYFQGQQAPKHTEDEAWEIFLEQTKAACDAGAKLIFVDGQPRSLLQLDRVKIELRDKIPCNFLNIYASTETRWKRNVSRHGDDEASLQLAEARLERDAAQLYELISRIVEFKMNLRSISTEEITIEELFHKVISEPWR